MVNRFSQCAQPLSFTALGSERACRVTDFRDPNRCVKGEVYPLRHFCPTAFTSVWEMHYADCFDTVLHFPAPLEHRFFDKFYAEASQQPSAPAALAL